MPKKPDPIEHRNRVEKRYIDSGNTPQQAREKAQKQLEGYDRRRGERK